VDMFEKGRKMQQKLSTALDIPNDIILDLPKITVIGNVQLYLENHRGIIEYSPERIRIAAGNGEIEIAGDRLTIRSISKDDVHLDGVIEAIRYRR
jgi:sporulation protein YqfC